MPCGKAGCRGPDNDTENDDNGTDHAEVPHEPAHLAEVVDLDPPPEAVVAERGL